MDKLSKDINGNLIKIGSRVFKSGEDIEMMVSDFLHGQDVVACVCLKDNKYMSIKTNCLVLK